MKLTTNKHHFKTGVYANHYGAFREITTDD